MLTYIINVTEDLLALSVILGVIYGFVEVFCDEKNKRIFQIGSLAGFIIAGIRAYITNTRRIVGGWRIGAIGYGIALICLLLLFVLFVLRQTKIIKKKEVIHRLFVIITSLLVISYLFGSMPNVYTYPFRFDDGGNGILSTDFLFRLGGYIAGLLICLISGMSSYFITTLLAKKGYKALLKKVFIVLNVIYGVYNFARLMLVLTPRGIIKSVALFQFSAFSNNHSAWYTYFVFLIVLGMGIYFWIQSYKKKEVYHTNAQHRKQKVVWRSGKRHTVVIGLCFVFGILSSTWFVDLNTIEINEAPIEDPVVIKDSKGNDGELRVPLEMVNDGHLHRFGYQVDNNLVRFIVVLKQENTNNYGIGLDACEICGEAGYYENNDGQIVCKKCGVVMNTTTIGMKGGCNPIIIDYDITEGYITVPVSEMIKNQSHFKS